MCLPSSNTIRNNSSTATSTKKTSPLVQLPMSIPTTYPQPLLQQQSASTSTTTNNRNKTKKSVRFNQVVHVVPFERTSAEEAKCIWFTNAEIVSFKEKGRELALFYRKRDGKTQTTTSTLCNNDNGNERSLYRGFEGCTIKRQRRRALSNRCVVYAHKNGLDESFVASMYQQCNQWSTEVAFVQAVHDYVDVFYSNDINNNKDSASTTYSETLTAMMIPSVSSMVPPPEIAFAVHGAHALKKQQRRKRLSSISNIRRVRARVC